MPVADRKTEDLRFRGGLAVLERLAMPFASLESTEVARLLGAKGPKGIGSAFHSLRSTLENRGIAFHEAVRREPGRAGSVWTAGPRIEQARHVAGLEWRLHEDPAAFWDGVPMETPGPAHVGPVLVLRALHSAGEIFAFPNFTTLVDVVDDRSVVNIPADHRVRFLGEVFIHRIEPGHDGAFHRVPEGYGENGLWIRGGHDFCDEGRVWDPGCDAALQGGEVYALVCDMFWIERRVALVDAVRQWERAAVGAVHDQEHWKPIRPGERFRTVGWISRDILKGRRPPPVFLRTRFWHDVHIVTDGGRRTVLREEGIRGDVDRTAVRAVMRWRRKRRSRSGMRVTIRSVGVSPRQPRPLKV